MKRLLYTIFALFLTYSVSAQVDSVEIITPDDFTNITTPADSFVFIVYRGADTTYLKFTVANAKTLFQDGTGTDNQTIDTFDLTGNTLSLSIESDGEAAKTVDLSGYLDNTDDQVVDTFELSGTTLRLSLESDGETVKTVDLSSLQDGTGTDSQTLSFSSPTLTISGGNSVDISAIDTDTDDQQIDTFDLSGTTLRLSLQDDAQPLQTVDLSSLQDGTGTDDQTASEVPITDAGGYYTGTDVEAALSEIADTLTQHRTDIDAGSDDQTLSLSGDTLSIESGNSINLKLIRGTVDITPTNDTTITIAIDSYYVGVFQIDMTTASTTSTIDLTASNPVNGGVYTFHFQNTGSTNSLNLPTTFLDQTGTALDGGTTYDIDASDVWFTCYYDGTNYYCK